jgi:RNA polymerase sigma-70 factor (ECF subfamily)
VKQLDEATEYQEMLFKYALKLSKNIEDAEDLVQLTYLKTFQQIINRNEIGNVGAYLRKSLLNIYNNSIRVKRKHEKTNELYISQDPQYERDFKEIIDEEITKNQMTREIRKELAHLSKPYRDVVTLFYMEGKHYNEIAEILNINDGTVKSRLNKAKEILKKGVEEMKEYAESSYKPRYLSIHYSGTPGKNGEPENIISNLVDQNILILAYENPMTPVEISKIIGTPVAYIEDSVNKLLKYGFLRQTAEKVSTNFIIIDESVVKKNQKIAKPLVDDSYNEVLKMLNELISEYNKLGLLNSFTIEQKYIYAILQIASFTRQHWIDSMKLLKFDDFSPKDDGSTWVIDFGYKTDKEQTNLHLYTRGPLKEYFNKVMFIEEYDFELSKTFLAPYSFTIKTIERARIIYDIHRNKEIDSFYSNIVNDLEKLGFIKKSKVENRQYECFIPVITEQDYELLNKLGKKYGRLYVNLMENDIMEIMKRNKLSHPKLINPKQMFIHINSMTQVPTLLVEKLSENGVINIVKGANYPVSVIVEHY